MRECFKIPFTDVESFFIDSPPSLLQRSFAKPPRAVQMVSECIVVMRGFKEVSWKQAKGMMSEANFLKSLTDMDVDGITSAQVLHFLNSIHLFTINFYLFVFFIYQSSRYQETINVFDIYETMKICFSVVLLLCH